MATVRLNVSIRSEILNAAIESKFPTKSRVEGQNNILEREVALVEEIYTEIIGEKNLKKIQESEIEKYIPFSDQFSINVGCHNGYKVHLSVPYNFYKDRDNKFKFYSIINDGRVITYRNDTYYIKNKKLSDKIEKYLSDREDHNKVYIEAYNKLEAFLNSFMTIGQLQKNWPEGEVFYRKFIEDSPKRIVPAIVTADINKMFNLPPKRDNEFLPE